MILEQGLAIGFDNVDCAARARVLADTLHLPLDNHAPNRLCVTRDKLVLLIPGFSPLFVDFEKGLARRDAGKQQGLVRACKPKFGMRILDATAGWGRDAAILASFGAAVLMLERHPVMAALLADGLDRCVPASLALSLQPIDAMHYLHTLPMALFPDVIYIDPMHPVRKKSALVKGDMQVLQRLIGTQTAVEAFIQLARARVLERVVVKWPQRLSPLVPPTSSIPGKTVRFDMYTPQG